MAVSPEFLDFIREQMAGFGPITIRKMFGGAGVYHDGLMFGLIADEVLYLKAGVETKGAFEAEGLGPFVYEAKGGKNTVMSYWRCPARCLDDPDVMRDWARTAYDAALKVARGKR